MFVYRECCQAVINAHALFNLLAGITIIILISVLFEFLTTFLLFFKGITVVQNHEIVKAFICVIFAARLQPLKKGAFLWLLLRTIAIT